MRLREIATSLVNLFIGAVMAILGLRFLLRLLGANADNGFVSWIYEMSGVLLAPFRGIFPTTVFENRFVLDFTTLFAMLIYAVFGLLIIALINAITAPADTVTKRRR